jgi:hypothetical protein
MPSSIRSGFPVLLAMATLASPLRGQVAGQWSSCKTDSLSTFNCGQYYTGTVTLTSELKGPNVHQSLQIVAAVAGGKVTCTVKGTEVGDFAGPGMLAVEHENTANAGGYSISVWCPESAGERPRRGDAPRISITKQRATDYAILEGKDSYDHPDTDAANGISGKESVTWTLRRP